MSGVFYTAQNLQESCIVEPVYLRPDDKSSVFPVKTKEFQTLKTARKPSGSFTLQQKLLVELFEFLKETGCLPSFAGNLSDITVFWSNQGNNRYGSQHSKKFSRNISSHGSEQCVLSVSLTLLGNLWKVTFVILGTVLDGKSVFYFLPGKARNLRIPQTPPKNTLFHLFPSLKLKIWSIK